MSPAKNPRPEPPGKGPPRRLVIGVAGAVAVAIVVAAAVVLATRDGNDTTTAPTGTTAEDHPPTTTMPRTTAPTTTTTAPTTTTSTGPVTTVPPPSGNAGPGCVNGWIVPTPGTARRVEPVDVIRRDMGITGEFQVIEMRHFTGPEVPWILEPRPPVVERWYVKAQLVDDPAFRARWLVEKRSPAVEGIAAVAPFGTAGYQSPDWRGFIGEGEPHTVEGLPGTWVGFDYDFLTGEHGEKPGLPNEVVHCLDGT